MTTRLAWLFLLSCACSKTEDAACRGVRCANGGTCTAPSEVPICLCPPGWSGDLCSITDVPAVVCPADFVGSDCAEYAPRAPVDLSVVSTGARTCADGGDMLGYAVVALAAGSATVSTPIAAGCLVAGDEILLVSLQGSATAVFNVGAWELLHVQSVSGSEVVFAAPKTKSYGDAPDGDVGIGVSATNQHVLLQRVPRYRRVTIAASVSLTGAAWDGARGGVFAIRVDGDTTLSGPIDMHGKGFRGGAANTLAMTAGQQGESLRGTGKALVSSNIGGGGGGSGAGTCGSAAAIGNGGGGGGHGSAGQPGSAASCGGGGGGTYENEPLDRIFLGSGGGSGGAPPDLLTSPAGGAGGNGGGIVLLFSGGTLLGDLLASGADGRGDVLRCDGPSTSSSDCWDDAGPGGGGAGGSVWVETAQRSGTTSIEGGRGGRGVATMAGDGGAGGAGQQHLPQ